MKLITLPKILFYRPPTGPGLVETGRVGAHLVRHKLPEPPSEPANPHPSEAVQPEHLEPQGDKRGYGDRSDEYYAKRGKRLIPARRERANCCLFGSCMSYAQASRA